MPVLTADAMQLLYLQLGAATSDQLRRAGVSDHSRRRLIADGVLTEVGRAVYRVPTIPLTLEARAVVLSLQHPTGFITGPTAGALLGLRRMPTAAQIHFSIAHGVRFDTPNFVRLRQSTVILPHHTRLLPNGIRIATYGRLAFDLAADLTVPNLSSVVEQMMQRGHLAVDDLSDVAVELCRSHRPGSMVFARMLLRRGVGAAAESHPELLVLDGLRQRGVPVVAQQRLKLPNGRAIRIDMAVPEIRWAVEVDVHPDHFALEGTTNDVRRDRQLHLVDWQVDRVTTIDLLDLEATLTELVYLYRRRSATIAA